MIRFKGFKDGINVLVLFVYRYKINIYEDLEIDFFYALKRFRGGNGRAITKGASCVLRVIYRW